MGTWTWLMAAVYVGSVFLLARSRASRAWTPTRTRDAAGDHGSSGESEPRSTSRLVGRSGVAAAAILLAGFLLTKSGDALALQTGLGQSFFAVVFLAIATSFPPVNEEAALPLRARDLALQEPPWEWVVADGGSADAAVEVAAGLGAKVLHAPLGRGAQLNAGAGRLADRVFTAANAARQRLFGIFFGDSVMFARREVFAELGGFPAEPILEDHVFARRLRSAGRVVRLPLTVQTSRRDQGRVLRTVLGWAAINLLFELGVPAAELARLYPPPGRAELPRTARGAHRTAWRRARRSSGSAR